MQTNNRHARPHGAKRARAALAAALIARGGG